MSIKVTKIDEILKPLGYERKWYDYLDGTITGIDYCNEIENHPISIQIDYDEDYLEELKDKGPVETDFNRCSVTNILFPCVLVTEECWLDGSKDGIVLSVQSDDPYHVNELTIENVNKALWIMKHVDEHEIQIMKKHIENVQLIHKRVDKFNEKYNYFCKYDPIFDTQERKDSNLYLNFEGDWYSYDIGTNAFSGDIYINSKYKVDLTAISDEDLLALIIPVEKLNSLGKRDKRYI